MRENKILLVISKFLKDLKFEYDISSAELCKVMGVTLDELEEYENAEKTMDVSELLLLCQYAKSEKHADISGFINEVFSV